MTEQNGDTIKRICDRFNAMKAARSVFENHWEEVAEVTSPIDRKFTSFHSPGEKKRTGQYDSVTELSLKRATSFYDSVTTPRNKRWHGIRGGRYDLQNNQEVREYYDVVENVLFQHRYGPRANFPSQRNKQVHSLFGFGNGAIFVDMVDRRIRYRFIHLSNLYFDENAWGMIDVVYRKTKMNRRQLEQRFGEDSIPESVKKKSGSSGQAEEKYEVIHATEPNPNYDPESVNPEERKYITHYVLNESDKVLLEVGGYDNFPYAISRDGNSEEEVYGRGIAMTILPNTKMVNQMKKTHIEAGHMAIRPTLLMKDDGSVSSVDLRPGKIIRGGLDASGNRTLDPLNHGARYDISSDMLASEHNMIREAFMLDLFISNLEREATATEVLTRSQEQARLLAPMSGQEETESLAIMIEREVGLHYMAGNLPPMPQILQEAMGEFEIEYTSPIANSQKADEALGATQTVQQVYAAAQFDPNALDMIDFDEYIRLQGEANGTPAKIIRGEDDVAAIREQRAQQQQQQMMMENAKNLSGAALDVARAEKTAQEI